MSQPEPSYAQICARILDTPTAPHRRLIAVAGPPGSGKSTFAAELGQMLEQQGAPCAVVPMDGFHLDNRLLDADGNRFDKGSPQTFDVAGTVRLVAAMQENADLIYPLFDRRRDIAIAGAARLPASCQTVLIEGNYLLYDAPLWRALAAYWTFSIALTPSRALLQKRLVQRWLDHGMSAKDARLRAEANDLKNADLVLRHLLPADLTLTEVPK